MKKPGAYAPGLQKLPQGLEGYFPTKEKFCE